jgi:hypothetical protein
LLVYLLDVLPRLANLLAHLPHIFQDLRDLLVPFLSWVSHPLDGLQNLFDLLLDLSNSFAHLWCPPVSPKFTLSTP